MLFSHLIWTFIILIVIGAVIGGMTNAIAIKMLFRPYNPVYIGRWRVPFTPGLIPKRRQELSEQLGQMVMSHLLTAEGIEKKLRQPDFINRINNWAQDAVSHYIDKRIPIREHVRLMTDPDRLIHLTQNKTEQWIKETLEQWTEDKKQQSLEMLLPIEWEEKIVSMTPQVTDYIIDNLTSYLESDEGKSKLKEQVDGFLSGRGMFGNMLQFFLGNQSLIDKLHPEVLSFINRTEFKQVITDLLKNEWVKLKQKPLSEVIQIIEINQVVEKVTQGVVLQLPFNNWLDRSVYDYIVKDSKGNGQIIIETLIPKITDGVIGLIASKTNDVLGALQLEEVVKQEVDTFSVHRLEEIVLMISKREFKMITYLGALLGAIIGLFQGIVIMLIR